jgi:hypothetical protein
MTHLWDRVAWAHEHLTPVQTDLVIVWEDPDAPDSPACVTVPAPEWLAMAMYGGLLPPVEHYHDERRDPDGTFVGPKDHWSAYTPLGALTEEEALEYIVMKDIPRRVWDPPEGSNARHFVICRREQLPATRRWRNAWTLKP